MGTRSLTHVLDDDTEAVLVTIYRQMDGYPTGMGNDLADFLSGRSLVNGFGPGTPEKASNGMGCLAAELVKELKDGIGGIYIEPPGSDDHGEEYIYTVAGSRPTEPTLGVPGSAKPTSPHFKVQAVRGGWDGKPRTLVTLYEGPADKFDAEKAESAERSTEER